MALTNQGMIWDSVSSSRRPSLAVTGGVHTALDAVKAVMAGANAVQLGLALLRCPNPAAHERANSMTILQSWWR